MFKLKLVRDKYNDNNCKVELELPELGMTITQIKYISNDKGSWVIFPQVPSINWKDGPTLKLNDSGKLIQYPVCNFDKEASTKVIQEQIKSLCKKFMDSNSQQAIYPVLSEKERKELNIPKPVAKPEEPKTPVETPEWMKDWAK